MPLVRSHEDIPSVVDKEPAILDTTFEQGACGNAGIHANPARGAKTRAQARREAVVQDHLQEDHLRRLVEESMSGFRQEIANLITDRFQQLMLVNQGQDGQDRSSNNDDHQEHEQRIRERVQDWNGNSDKILNIIRNWKIRFTGDISDISVEEFIYRVNTLTNVNLGGDFRLLCSHAHLLFEGKALKWFWRYHRSYGNVNWDDLCSALKRQYKDFNTDFDIRNELLRRKQKPHESFDDYYDALMLLCDRLLTPLSDYELCEIMQSNLKQEIRHELLHLEITSIAQLRRAVRRHEKFVKEMSSSNLNKRSFSKGQVSEVVKNNLEEDSKQNCEIIRTEKCWNCGKTGHGFIDCLEPRTIFCYGCGMENVYKPQCTKCTGKSGNGWKDVRGKKRGHPKQH